MISKYYIARNNKKLIAILSMLIASMIFVPVVSGEEIISPQVRYVNVEKITIEQISIGSGPEEPEYVDACHFVYTFKLFRVDQWADRCYFKLWLDGEIIGEWSVGFSADTPPGLQGIYQEYFNGLIQIDTIMTEFPYEAQVIVHPEDGEQTYYSYKMHFYFEKDVFNGKQLRIAGAYMQEPTYQDNDVTVLRILKPKIIDGVETFRLKTVKHLPIGKNK